MKVERAQIDDGGQISWEQAVTEVQGRNRDLGRKPKVIEDQERAIQEGKRPRAKLFASPRK